MDAYWLKQYSHWHKYVKAEQKITADFMTL